MTAGSKRDGPDQIGEPVRRGGFTASDQGARVVSQAGEAAGGENRGDPRRELVGDSESGDPEAETSRDHAGEGEGDKGR